MLLVEMKGFTLWTFILIGNVYDNVRYVFVTVHTELPRLSAGMSSLCPISVPVQWAEQCFIIA